MSNGDTPISTIAGSLLFPEFSRFEQSAINDTNIAFISLDSGLSAAGVFAGSGGPLTPVADSATWGIGALAINNADTVTWAGAGTAVLADDWRFCGCHRRSERRRLLPRPLSTMLAQSHS